jgi:CRP/FNR family cyclic AMP-dependent transcriptional regulator
MTLTLDGKRELLAATELFSGADAAGLELLADRTVEVDVPEGHVLVRQGDDGTGLFLIVSGAVRVVHDGATVARLGAGEIVGELAVIDRQPRLAQVVTDEPTVCLALASWDLESVIRAQPEVALALLRVLARRLRESVNSHSH